MKSCLLSFSGGLDSVAAAVLLKEQGYAVTLGHIRWLIEGTSFGEAQTVAAHSIAKELELPWTELAHMWFPADSFAKYSWVPVCISTIMHHAGDPCVYPAEKVRRFDSVAFGTDFLEVPEHDNRIRRWWLTAMQHYAYDGEILYPLEGMERDERAALIPKRLLDMTVSCYEGPGGVEPCGKCWKCVE